MSDSDSGEVDLLAGGPRLANPYQLVASKMRRYDTAQRPTLLAFFQSQLGEPPWLWRADVSRPELLAGWSAYTNGIAYANEEIFAGVIGQVQRSGGSMASVDLPSKRFAADASAKFAATTHSLVCGLVPAEDGQLWWLACVLAGPAALTQRLVQNAVQAWQMQLSRTNTETSIECLLGFRPPHPHRQTLWLGNQPVQVETLRAFSRAIDARDPYTYGHSQRVATTAYGIAQRYGLSPVACREIFVAGMLHDIGKIGVPDEVLLKQGKLTDDEYRVIQQHPQIGYRIIEQLGEFQFALPGILYHHERWDGAGYPQGLRGETIPIMGRLLAVADAFDAMTSSRPYRQALPRDKALAIIQDGSGQQWEPRAVEAFCNWYSAAGDLPTAVARSRTRSITWDRTRPPGAVLLRSAR